MGVEKDRAERAWNGPPKSGRGTGKWVKWVKWVKEVKVKEVSEGQVKEKAKEVSEGQVKVKEVKEWRRR